MADPRLHLLQLSSPALPVGAYAYSQAMEYAVEAGWLSGELLHTWLEDGLEFGLGQLDLPVLLRAHAASAVATKQQRDQRLSELNDRLLAARETRELLLEDQQVGGALWRLLGSLHDEALPQLEQRPGYAIAFAVACQRWQIEGRDSAMAFAYSWLENQVAAATKLVPLGQTDAQRLLVSLLEHIPAVCDAATVVEDDAIGCSLPGLAMASCRHEHQHTRLFRS